MGKGGVDSNLVKTINVVDEYLDWNGVGGRVWTSSVQLSRI